MCARIGLSDVWTSPNSWAQSIRVARCTLGSAVAPARSDIRAARQAAASPNLSLRERASCFLSRFRFLFPVLPLCHGESAVSIQRPLESHPHQHPTINCMHSRPVAMCGSTSLPLSLLLLFQCSVTLLSAFFSWRVQNNVDHSPHALLSKRTSPRECRLLTRRSLAGCPTSPRLHPCSSPFIGAHPPVPRSDAQINHDGRSVLPAVQPSRKIDGVTRSPYRTISTMSPQALTSSPQTTKIRVPV